MEVEQPEAQPEVHLEAQLAEEKQKEQAAREFNGTLCILDLRFLSYVSSSSLVV